MAGNDSYRILAVYIKYYNKWMSIKDKLYGEKTFQQQKRGILVNIIIYDELVKLYADHKVEMI